MIPRVGNSGSEVQVETQMLLLEAKKEFGLLDEVTEPTTDGTFYILVLPVLEGAFRASLQGTATNELQFCVESGQLMCSNSRRDSSLCMVIMCLLSYSDCFLGSAF